MLAAVDARHDDALEVISFVHAHPELGHEEHECSRFVAGRLESGGFELEYGCGGMDTAFRAVLEGGRPGRSVGLVCLYDAVAAVRPDGSIDAVHSCGHGPIAGGRDRRGAGARRPTRRLRRAARRRGLPGRRDPCAEHGAPRRRQGALGRGGAVGRRGRSPLRAPRVHRHGVARVAMDATAKPGGQRRPVARRRARAAAAGGPDGAGRERAGRDGGAARARRRCRGGNGARPPGARSRIRRLGGRARAAGRGASSIASPKEPGREGGSCRGFVRTPR